MQKLKVLMIDNYDSFTYNVTHLIYTALCALKNEKDFEIIVKLNDKITITEIEKLDPFCIFISPGPCSPNEAGICLSVIEHFYKTKPIFGVCLGHQAICQFFGGSVVKVFPYHGRESNILLVNTTKQLPRGQFSYDGIIQNSPIFNSIEDGFSIIRYHSLALEPKTTPQDLKVTAIAKQDGVVMAVEHIKYPVFGVQFHPESVLSTNGLTIFTNFFSYILSLK